MHAHRYSYLNLCHFLATKKYMLPYGQGEIPSLNDEREYGDWDRFYKEGPEHLAMLGNIDKMLARATHR